MNGVRQFGRKCNLVVAGKSKALDVSGLRIAFHVTKNSFQSPNSAEIKIFNVAPGTAREISEEFKIMALEAGYEENNGVIFVGNIRQAAFGAEIQPTDTALSISAGDGDRAYNGAFISRTLAAGADFKQQIGALATELVDTVDGFVEKIDSPRTARGKVFFGNVRSKIRQVCGSNGATWSIQDGRLQVLKSGGASNAEVVVLSPDTGLIGSPERINGGVRARCLLNPRIGVGNRIKIDDKVLGVSKVQGIPGDILNTFSRKVSVSGMYRVASLEHIGDTHGNDWYTEMFLFDLGSVSRGRMNA